MQTIAKRTPTRVRDLHYSSSNTTTFTTIIRSVIGSYQTGISNRFSVKRWNDNHISHRWNVRIFTLANFVGHTKFSTWISGTFCTSKIWQWRCSPFRFPALVVIRPRRLIQTICPLLLLHRLDIEPLRKIKSSSPKRFVSPLHLQIGVGSTVFIHRKSIHNGLSLSTQHSETTWRLSAIQTAQLQTSIPAQQLIERSRTHSSLKCTQENSITVLHKADPTQWTWLSTAYWPVFLSDRLSGKQKHINFCWIISAFYTNTCGTSKSGISSNSASSLASILNIIRTKELLPCFEHASVKLCPERRYQNSRWF